MKMRKYTLFVFYFVASIFTTNSYKILGIFPSLDRNNYLTYRGLFRELANRNHEVTLISHFELQNAPDTYKKVLLSDKHVYKGLSFESVIVNELSRVPFETLVSTKAGNDDCKTLMNNNQVLHMIRTRPRYDVILVESYNSDCALALAMNFSAPYIAFNPQSIQPWHYSRAGINFNSAYVPQAGLLYGRHPWFFERLKSYIVYHVTNWVYYVGSQVTDHVYLYKYLGDNLPPLETIASNASALFVNTHQSVFGGIARADTVIDVGGLHLTPPKILPSDIERFINEAEHGVLYVNLGSTVKDSTLPRDKLDELVSTFNKLPLRVLWKWDGGNIENMPRNIMTMRWLPQYDILKHDNVKAFISHGGILSSIEAVDAGVPLIVIPLFGNQYGNAALLRDAGIATVVSYQDLNREYLLDAIKEVLHTKWQHHAKLVSKLWHDRPMSALDTAVYWTEYVARHQGTPNLQATSATLPLYQTLQLDVLAFIGLVAYILAFVICKILSICCCCSSRSETISRGDVTQESEGKRKRVKFE